MVTSTHLLAKKSFRNYLISFSSFPMRSGLKSLWLATSELIDLYCFKWVVVTVISNYKLYRYEVLRGVVNSTVSNDDYDCVYADVQSWKNSFHSLNYGKNCYNIYSSNFVIGTIWCCSSPFPNTKVFLLSTEICCRMNILLDNCFIRLIVSFTEFFSIVVLFCFW